MHTFPQLRKIERKYRDKVAVVGVHSPKFAAERDTANLREAVLRYRIEHPVVNDRDFEVWRRFGGRAWPTLVFVDPEGRLIGKHEGELPFAQFDPLVQGCCRALKRAACSTPRHPPWPWRGLPSPRTRSTFRGRCWPATTRCTSRTAITIGLSRRRSMDRSVARSAVASRRWSTVRRNMRRSSNHREWPAPGRR